VLEVLPEQLPAYRERQLRPLLVLEERAHRGAVVVLDRPAAGLRAHQLDAVALLEDAHVVAHVAQRLPELGGQLVRAGDPGVVEAGQYALAEWVAERLGDALVDARPGGCLRTGHVSRSERSRPRAR